MHHISYDEALRLFKFAHLDVLQERAMKKRYEKHPNKSVSFVIDSNPNYTNICTIDCTFCAFYRTKKAKDAYHKNVDEVLQHLEYAQSMGATTVLLQGGVHDGVTIDYLEELVRISIEKYPHIHPHYFSAVEIWNAAHVSSISVEEALYRLWNAGLRTIPGGGAEILSERVRKRISPKKMGPNGWLDLHTAAHAIGFKTTATMMYGHIETEEELIEHLFILHEAQEKSGGFTSFIPWSYKRNNTALRRYVDRLAGREKYLRVLAISRIILDSFPHIGSSWFSEGKEVGRESLQFGADDFGGTILEENVHKATGHINTTHAQGIIRMIREAGFEPIQRDSFYRPIRIFPIDEEETLSLAPFQEIEQLSS